MQTWTYSLLSVLIVSIISLVGIFSLSLKKDQLKNILFVLVSFAVGALVGDAFIHLIPESFEKIEAGLLTSLLVIAGMLIFFTLEKFIRWRHCHIDIEEKHIHPVVSMNMIGDGVHNFIDGMLIAASYLVSIPLGIATTLAVIFHEIPQEIGDFGVLVHGGLSTGRALFFNFISALTAVLGAVILMLVGLKMKEFTIYLLPITAGGFLYIAGSDLVPELHHECELSKSLLQLIAIIAGIAIMALLIFLE